MAWAQGTFLGLRPYFTVYISSCLNTDTILTHCDTVLAWFTIDNLTPIPYYTGKLEKLSPAVKPIWPLHLLYRFTLELCLILYIALLTYFHDLNFLLLLLCYWLTHTNFILFALLTLLDIFIFSYKISFS